MQSVAGETGGTASLVLVPGDCLRAAHIVSCEGVSTGARPPRYPRPLPKEPAATDSTQLPPGCA